MKAFLKYSFALFCLMTLIPAVLGAMHLLPTQDVKQFIADLPSLGATLPVFFGIVTVLALDIFLPVPTLAVMILAGYVMGLWPAFLASVTGGLIAVGIGYFLSLKHGDKLLLKIVSPDEAESLKLWFKNKGLSAVIVSRFIPLMPEILACLCGTSKMPAKRFFLWFGLATVPHALVCAYIGTVTSVDNPYIAMGFLLTPVAVGWILRSVRKFEKGSECAGFPVH